MQKKKRRKKYYHSHRSCSSLGEIGHQLFLPIDAWSAFDGGADQNDDDGDGDGGTFLKDMNVEHVRL